MGTRWSWSPTNPAVGPVLGVLLAGATLVGCSASPAGPRWRAVTLPPGGTGRPQVRALATCPGHWYAVGGYPTPDGGATPAAWASSDGTAWRALPTRPTSAYGPTNLLSAAACRVDPASPGSPAGPGTLSGATSPTSPDPGDPTSPTRPAGPDSAGAGMTMVAVGASAGGVHGNPRTGTWVSRDSGPLTETVAAFELYGGPNAIGVGRLAAGPAGFVIEGARVGPSGIAGAATWTARDGTGFRLVDGDPVIASGPSGTTVAQDVTSTPDGFVLVGSMSPTGDPGASRVPLVATSPDGVTWRRESVPGTGRDAEAQRVIRYRGGLLAVGVDGAGFGAWRRDAHGWHVSGPFGGFAGSGLPLVTGLAVDAAGVGYAVLTDGRAEQLWRSADGVRWRRVDLPVPVPDGGVDLVALAGNGGDLLLAEDGALFLGSG